MNDSTHDPIRTLHRPLHVRWSAAVATLFLSGLALAQAPIPTAGPGVDELVGPTGALGRAHGVRLVEDRPVAVGKGYRADFRAGRAELLPALGPEAPRSLPLGFELEGVWRGEELVHAADPGVAPTLAGSLVRYERGASIVERYEVTDAGVLQSFFFDSLPAGQGDLVVRGRLHTDLPAPVPSADGGLRFAGVHGGVRFGAVTGIDADGRTVAGTLRSDGERLELVLPADFVAGAAFPLVLDPLISPIVTIDDGASYDSNPAVCRALLYYYVVWQRTYSAFDADILLQRMTSTGTLEGPAYLIASEGVNYDPSIGWVSAAGRLLIAWNESPVTLPLEPRIRMASYRTNDHDVQMGPYANLALAGNETRVRVGGDETGADDEAFLVWEEDGAGIKYRLITVVPDAPPIHAGPVGTIDATTAGAEAIRPDLSESVDTNGDFLVVWERRNLVNDHGQIWGRAYTRNGVAIGAGPTYLSGEIVGSRSSHWPSCDGDGKNFLVAYERAEGLLNDETDIACKPVTLRGLQLVVGVQPKLLAADSTEIEKRPCVAVTGGGAVVAWTEPQVWVDGFAYVANSLYCTNVDLYTGKGLGDIEVVHDGDDVSEFDLCARAAGADSGSNKALIVWDAKEPDEDQRDVRAMRFDVANTVYDMFGGCGASGLHKIQCAVAGNSQFAIHLRDATPGSLAVLVISGALEVIDCGPCSLWPSLQQVYYAETDAYGDARIDIPIGAELAGVDFYSQWAVFAPGGVCTLGQLNLTRGLHTTIGTAP